ncbi:MAG: hypothetical protein WC809_07290 [Sinimarinibacterium sp.]
MEQIFSPAGTPIKQLRERAKRLARDERRPLHEVQDTLAQEDSGLSWSSMMAAAWKLNEDGILVAMGNDCPLLIQHGGLVAALKESTADCAEDLEGFQFDLTIKEELLDDDDGGWYRILELGASDGLWQKLDERMALLAFEALQRDSVSGWASLAVRLENRDLCRSPIEELVKVSTKLALWRLLDEHGLSHDELDFQSRYRYQGQTLQVFSANDFALIAVVDAEDEFAAVEWKKIDIKAWRSIESDMRRHFGRPEHDFGSFSFVLDAVGLWQTESGRDERHLMEM